MLEQVVTQSFLREFFYVFRERRRVSEADCSPDFAFEDGTSFFGRESGKDV